MHTFTRRLIRLRRESPGLRYGALVTLYLTETLYAYTRVFPSDPRIVVLNNGSSPVEAEIPIHSNPRLPTMICNYIPNGLQLVDGLCPERRTQVVDGCVQVRVPGKTGAVYGAVRA
jgi:hypothetical protein